MKNLMSALFATLLAWGSIAPTYGQTADAMRDVMKEINFERTECRGSANLILIDVCARITAANAQEQLGEPTECKSDIDPENMFKVCKYDRASGMAGGITVVYFVHDRAFKIETTIPSDEFNKKLGDSLSKTYSAYIDSQISGVTSFIDGDDYMYHDPLSHFPLIRVSWGSWAMTKSLKMYP